MNIRFSTTTNDRNRILLTRVAEALQRSASHVRTISCVNDYGPGDPAQAKVEDALIAHTGVAHFTHTYVRPYDTLSGSYNILTQVLAPEIHLPKGKIGYLNVAPIEASEIRNGSHPFLCVLLKNGRVIFSPNSLFSLSLITPYAEVIFEMPCAKHGEQFRSWQSFPVEIGRILRYDFENVTNVWAATDQHPIPRAPATQFACQDNFGNCKSLLRTTDIVEAGIVDGDILEITVDDLVVAEAIYGKNTHRLAGANLLSFAPGSGLIQAHADAPIETFVDLFILHRSAVEILGDPTFDQIVQFRKKQLQKLNPNFNEPRRGLKTRTGELHPVA